VSPPAPTRCPRCGYLPAAATVICLACRNDHGDAQDVPRCPYSEKPCNCGLKGYCLTEIA
jgi:hypothetical protein